MPRKHPESPGVQDMGSFKKPLLSKDVIDHFGGVPALARAIGTTRHNVYQFQRRRLPEKWAIRISRLDERFSLEYLLGEHAEP